MEGGGAHLCESCSGSRSPSWLGPGSASRSPGSGTPCRCHQHARSACVITSVIFKGGECHESFMKRGALSVIIQLAIFGE